MKLFALIVGGLFLLYGGWLIPSTDDEARSVQAPYRCVRGVIWQLLALFMLLIGLITP